MQALFDLLELPGRDAHKRIVPASAVLQKEKRRARQRLRRELLSWPELREGADELEAGAGACRTSTRGAAETLGSGLKDGTLR